MSNIQLYQKYRPKSFNEVAGHEKIVSSIKKLIVNDEVPQSIYISGITGTGKTTLAYLILKAINCTNRPKDSADPCNECENCKDVDTNNFSFSGNRFNASDLDTDSMRSIKDLAQTYNLTGEKRVIIIDEIQELHNNKKAQKTLLSILEDINPDTHIILLSMDSSKVDNAIINRCGIRWKLPAVSFEDISRYLYSICEKEKIEIDDDKTDVILTIAENSGGSVRDATTLLENVISRKTWTVKELLEEFEILRDEDILDICFKILDGSSEAIKFVSSQEIVERIRYAFSFALKIKLGYSPSKWEQNQVGKLSNKPIEHLQYVVDELFKLFNYPYINKEIIQYHVMNCIMNLKSMPVKETKIVERQARQPRTERTI